MAQAKEDFQLKLEKGRVGEFAVLEALGKITEVKDLTDYTVFKGYQQKGLDFEFLNRKTNTWDRGDAKANIQPNGLTFMELYKGTGKLGWFNTTKSDWIFCYSVYTKIIYFYSVNEMRGYIDKRLKDRSIKTSHLRDGCIGVWLPVEKNPLIEKLA
jgi:hypothetical protein